MKHLQFFCWLVLSQTCRSFGFVLHAFPPITRTLLEAKSTILLEPRAISTELSTCGYLNGDPDKERTADSGFNCRVDTRNGLWGFCPTTVLTASDCGLAGHCIDSGRCSRGCGMTDTDLTTFTCGRNSFCSTAILTFGIDQEYSYIACGAKATVENYLVSPSPSQETIITTTEQTTSQKQTSTVVSSDTTSSTIEIVDQTSTETTSSSSKEESSESSPNNLGPIIGGVIGGLVIICLTIVVVIFLLRRNRRRNETTDSSKTDTAKTLWPQNDNELKAPQELDGAWSVQEMPAQRNPHGPVELAA